ncbi:MAG: dihydrolipoamide acetyltransferase family protein [Flavobacteriaceae bacterium]|nr:dihydrolipoamide acetyltransferase family protein [Flavobacteriaceae bacterium]
MGKYFLKLPKMGESVAEATLITWLKEVGDNIEADESIVEIATDKVDSDVPSEFSGKLIEKRFNIDDLVKVGEVIAVIETDEVLDEKTEQIEVPNESSKSISEELVLNDSESIIESQGTLEASKLIDKAKSIINTSFSKTKRFYSPLVKSIAKKENLSDVELKTISGTGKDGRVTKKDILKYLSLKSPIVSDSINSSQKPFSEDVGSKGQLIEMSRMGKLIANHMVESKKISAHVQSFVEVDVTNLWEWRENIKESFFNQTQEKLTFTPLFMLAVIKALRDFPILNSSLQGESILQKRDINIGMATSLSDGNLIVPVIKNADHLNLIGLTKAVNDLSYRARNNQLLPEEVQNGTYTVTNVGNFGSIMGTPIINQPQVGILAIGVIRKMPSVIETSKGDYIGIRKKLILSHTYDHRIINGAIGGQFAKNIANYLEEWDLNFSF